MENQLIDVEIQQLYPDVQTPFYASGGAAGMDVCAYVKNIAVNIPGDDAGSTPGIIIGKYETKIIPTGIKVAIPNGFELQVRPRSGLSVKTKLRVANSPGTIDSDYRGEIGIIIDNIGEASVIRHGDRIAQLVLAPVAQAKIRVVDSLDKTTRGEGGFGSTGVRA